MNADRCLLAILLKYCPAAGKSFDATDILYCCGRGSQALLYSVLFVPELTEFQGSIILACNVSDEESRARFEKGVREGKLSLEALEASFNFIEVGYLFDAGGRDTTDEEDEVLATQIAEAWRARLALCYPSRTFVVNVLSPSVTGSTVGVEFFEHR